MMNRNFMSRKVILLLVLGTLLAADSAMTIYSARVTSTDMTPQRQLAAQSALVRLLRADVKRAREIQQAVPKTQADCGLFEGSLPPVGTGYSVISEELQDLSQKSGLQIASLSFHPKDFTAHGITEVSLDAAITGDYKSVVRFLNALQHSKNRYVVDDLSLANERAGLAAQTDVKVNLHIRSYFRAMA
jgi:type IV pilus assembly protein PilO